MEEIKDKEQPSTSKSTNIIILSPEELKKLGLFKDVTTTTPEKSEAKHKNQSDELQDFGKKLATALNKKLRKYDNDILKRIDVKSRPKKTISPIIKSEIAKPVLKKDCFHPTEVIQLEPEKEVVECSSEKTGGGTVNLNIISNTPVSFSSEQLKNLVTHGKTNPQNANSVKKENPVQIISNTPLKLPTEEIKKLVLDAKMIKKPDESLSAIPRVDGTGNDSSESASDPNEPLSQQSENCGSFDLKKQDLKQGSNEVKRNQNNKLLTNRLLTPFIPESVKMCEGDRGYGKEKTVNRHETEVESSSGKFVIEKLKPIEVKDQKETQNTVKRLDLTLEMSKHIGLDRYGTAKLIHGVYSIGGNTGETTNEGKNSIKNITQIGVNTRQQKTVEENKSSTDKCAAASSIHEEENSQQLHTDFKDSPDQHTEDNLPPCDEINSGHLKKYMLNPLTGAFEETEERDVTDTEQNEAADLDFDSFYEKTEKLYQPNFTTVRKTLEKSQQKPSGCEEKNNNPEMDQEGVSGELISLKKTLSSIDKVKTETLPKKEDLSKGRKSRKNIRSKSESGKLLENKSVEKPWKKHKNEKTSKNKVSNKKSVKDEQQKERKTESNVKIKPSDEPNGGQSEQIMRKSPTSKLESSESEKQVTMEEKKFRGKVTSKAARTNIQKKLREVNEDVLPEEEVKVESKRQSTRTSKQNESRQEELESSESESEKLVPKEEEIVEKAEKKINRDKSKKNQNRNSKKLENKTDLTEKDELSKLPENETGEQYFDSDSEIEFKVRRPRKRCSTSSDLKNKESKKETDLEHEARKLDTSQETGPAAKSATEKAALVPSSPLPRKRGRPRKDATPKIIEQPSETEEAPMSSISATEKAALVSSSSLPRKRGRPRKEATPKIIEQPSETEEAAMSSSRRGRKRKEINYLLMENPDLDLDQTEKKKKRTVSKNCHSDGNSSDCTLAELSKGNNLTGDLQEDSALNSFAFSQEEETLNQSTISNKDTKNITINKTHKNIVIINEIDNTNNPTIKIELDNYSDLDASEGDASQTILKDKEEPSKKYKYTGDTVRMMSQIFSSSRPDGSTSGSLTPAKMRRGRPKQQGDESEIICNEDGTVTCMACNQGVQRDDWEYHKRKIHYDLAWRKGDAPLDVLDESFVLKKLNEIQKSEKKLKCHRCGKKETNPKLFLQHLDVCAGVVSTSGSVTCDVCKETMAKSKWPFHRQRKHNNLAWREGDNPLDLNDQVLVMNILNALYKNKKPLYCERCGTSKKSVIGFLSHQSTCMKAPEEQESIKMTCQICQRRMLPVSLQLHMKTVHGNKGKEIYAAAAAASDYFNVELAPGSKRKAAKRAASVLEYYKGNTNIVSEQNKYFAAQMDFGDDIGVTYILKKELANQRTVRCKFKECQFKDENVKNVLEHMSTCSRRPSEYFTCRKCLLNCETKEEILEHIKTAHDVQLTVDDYQVNVCDDLNSDDERDDEERIRRKILAETRKRVADPSNKIKPHCIMFAKKSPKLIFSHAYAWTMEFCETHFANLRLFDNLRTTTETPYRLLDDRLLEEYLPSVTESCDVAQKTIRISDKTFSTSEKDCSFERFQFFQAKQYGAGNNFTIFCGGPISAMGWLPTPHTNLDCDQILAVAVLKHMDAEYFLDTNYGEATVIQFWDLGKLRSKETGEEIQQPKFLFGLAHDCGPVWHLEWCPSGCYEQGSRLGLLAVASSDSHVYVYSVPTIRADDVGSFLKIKPVLKLQLDTNRNFSLGNQKYYATKISWTKASGHRHIAVGYTHGVVAIFKLPTNSARNPETVDVTFPCKVFQACATNITALALSHLSGGHRWLMTGSFDKDVFVWDLTHLTKISCFRKNIVSDGLWMTNWLTCLTSGDESSTHQLPVNMTAKPIRGFLYEMTNLTTSPSTIKSISSSDWLNGVIQGSALGEVVALFPNQLLHNFDSEKSWRRARRLFGVTQLVRKEEPKRPAAGETEQQEGEAIDYRRCADRYGLLFVDYKLDHYDDFQFPPDKAKKLFSEKLGRCRPDLYSLQSINKIAFNPNLQASAFYATGYQAGFVRLTHMRFLQYDPTVV